MSQLMNNGELENTWFAMAHTCLVSLFIVLAIVSPLFSCWLFNQAWIHKKALYTKFSRKEKALKDKSQKGSIEKLKRDIHIRVQKLASIGLINNIRSKFQNKIIN